MGCFREIVLMQIGQSMEEVLSCAVSRSLYVSLASSSEDGGGNLAGFVDEVASGASPIAEDSCERYRGC